MRGYRNLNEMIDITDLEDITLDGAQTLIGEENNELIEIAVPKSSQRYFSEPTKIAWDYAFAAYAAQELSKACTIIEYNFPEPTELESYFFTIKVTDKEALAKIVYTLSCLYGFTDDDEYTDGQAFEYVDQFIYEVENNKKVPIFPQLIEIFKEFLPGEDDKSVG